ncbi:Rha family transcriptional regulator [Xanthomonas sp. NCPPB 1067]|uniref:Rha family transcriptional regulator n=1 Tax=Xanthomonas sp. NCPPB 1067 TaxID=487524 RepID=UPI001E4FF784|nr:Rha family transcriptional regulator [Xanthomonas sp. NCPPB 1067]MCC4588762.1 Rha family transcriptional regulator [Xanthomonas sp. NCPPB 1067]
MHNIIQLAVVAGEPRVDSREISEHLGVDHRSAFRLITRYAERFRQFGLLRFEIAKPAGASAAGRPQSYALINEDQCYLLLALSRNTTRVLDLKVALVQAFGDCRRNGAAHALSYWQQLQKVDADDRESKAKASAGSRAMLERRRALPDLRARRLALESKVVPQLFAA